MGARVSTTDRKVQRMISIHEPSLDVQRALQADQGGYYWSRLATDLLRAHGLISVRRVPPHAPYVGASGIWPGADLILRETPPPAVAGAGIRICEGPLHPGMAALLGLEPGKRRVLEEATLVSADGDKIPYGAILALRSRSGPNLYPGAGQRFWPG
jgi:hypothetical protein